MQFLLSEGFVKVVPHPLLSLHVLVCVLVSGHSSGCQFEQLQDSSQLLSITFNVILLLLVMKFPSSAMNLTISIPIQSSAG
jgi:hypothetical protein